MAKRPTRLRFTEDDLADSHVKKAADRADKAVDRAEKAADKLASKKAKPKLKLETDAAHGKPWCRSHAHIQSTSGGVRI